eukprot:TRINITY_DN69026_c0_g1_i1.p1 TRINITY_DN69026_c0_g1~~TRINITY_DN69026_c0_g1_i1.p1  ORF type:complete len:389 (+),score=47.77 TRINITY_DN69026_c0_g1_i1:17-1183(+)
MGCCCSDENDRRQSSGQGNYGNYTQMAGPATGVVAAPVVGGHPPRPSGRRKALLIGINYFGTRAELRGCINDVRNMQALLTRQGFPASPDSMVVLTDDQQNPQAQPTRQNILASMQWLVSGAQEGDVLFLHYSGHGGQAPDPTYSEEDCMNETILPVDHPNGHISDDEMHAILVAPLPHGVRLTALMDCCHSGTVLDLPYLWANGRWEEEDNPAHSMGDVQMISGCLDEQTSADVVTSGRAGGALTNAFVEAFERYPGQSYAVIMNAIGQSMVQKGYSQRPLLSSSQQFDTNMQFSLVSNIVPNNNPQLGRQFRKRKKPPRDFGALGGILTGVATGFLAGAVINTLIGGMGHMMGGMGGLSSMSPMGMFDDIGDVFDDIGGIDLGGLF